MKGKIIGIVIVVLPIRVEDLLLYVWTQTKNIILNLIKWEVMLLAYDEKDVAAKTHYENKYFSIDVPEDWIGYWDVIEEENSLYVDQILYRLSYKPPVENYGGGAEIYILDISDTSVPLSVYRASIPDYAEEVGVVSFANYDVFVMEVGGGL